tara:strand:- start:126 stop:332 length:207 start_codon:yes stop_codon:yes gene_type:complete
MPTFYDKMFKPSKRKGIIRNKRTEWSNNEHENEFQEPIKLKDAEDYIIRQMFKTKKKSLANQKVDKKA